MRIVDSAPSELHTAFTWILRRRTSRGWQEVLRKKNIQTTYGLTAYASGFQGSYNAPLFMAIDTQHGSLQVSVSAGANSFQSDVAVHQAGGTQVLLDVSGLNPETLTFSSVTGSGPYTYHLTGTTAFSHTAPTAKITRVPKASDVVANFTAEAQFDSTNFPSQRITSLGGYSPGSGQWAMQFYFTKGQAAVYIARCGLFDAVALGAGNLHNEIALGYDNSAGTTDLELDILLALSN